MATFLLEVGLEEMPARMIAGAEQELGRRVNDLLSRTKLRDDASLTETFSTPRRLAVRVTGISERQPASEEQLTGPAVRIAYKDGQATPAAYAFAKKAGVEIDALTTVVTSKGEYVTAVKANKGQPAASLLVEQLPKELAQMYWAKSMYWRPGKPERFVRPLQWLLALLDEGLVPVEFAGVAAGKVTYGHRVLHGSAPIAIGLPSEYQEKLRDAFVMADVATRRHTIRKALDAVTRTVAGARWREDEALVETVTHLTEWPTVVLGSFEAEYLTLPEEVLVTVMRDHQKYFAVEDASRTLAPHFLAVLNTKVDEQGSAIIRHGNARVLRARFNDARFFWDYDQKQSLDARVEWLKNVTFQKDLGSYYQKTEANSSLATALAELIAARGVDVDREGLVLAVRLAKADLTAELVKEFTELQGVVGGLYARAQGHGEVVARAIYAQYQPASMEDAIPMTVEGQLLGLADRMNTIVDMFAVGLEPTGSKDPFALRRAANGVVKILAESRLPLKLSELIAAAVKYSARGNAESASPAVKGFLHERLEFHLREARGCSYDVVNATLATGADDVVDVLARAEALTAMRGSEDFAAVSSGFKRIKNILRQAAEKSSDFSADSVDNAQLQEPEEKELYAAAQRLGPEVERLQSIGDYRAALEQTALLRPVIDGFFDKVMVMAPDPELRRNRLALIAQVLRGFSRIGDVSEMTAPRTPGTA